MVKVAQGCVFYGEHKFTAATAAFTAADGYVYVNWNNDTAKLAFSSSMPQPTEYWHCAIIGRVKVSSGAVCIIQEQHGHVVQALSRKGIFKIVKENLLK